MLSSTVPSFWNHLSVHSWCSLPPILCFCLCFNRSSTREICISSYFFFFFEVWNMLFTFFSWNLINIILTYRDIQLIFNIYTNLRTLIVTHHYKIFLLIPKIHLYPLVINCYLFLYPKQFLTTINLFISKIYYLIVCITHK